VKDKLPMTIIDKIVLLRSVEVFQEVSVRDLGRLAEVAQELTMSAGEVVFQAGEPADFLLVLAEGQISVQYEGVEFLQLRSHQTFGGVNLLEGSTHDATAIALVPSHGLKLGREELLEMLERYPSAKTTIMRFMIRTVRKIRRRLVGLEQRVRELEGLAEVCVDPNERATSRGYDRLLRYTMTHRGAAAGELVYTERSEEHDGLDCQRYSFDAAVDLPGEYFSFMFRIEASVWEYDGQIVAAEGLTRQNAATVQISAHREAERLITRITHDDVCQELRIAPQDLDVTDLDIFFRLVAPHSPLEEGLERTVAVLRLTTGHLVSARLRNLGSDTVRLAGHELPAVRLQYEDLEERVDLWFHTTQQCLVSAVWHDNLALSAELVAREGYTELGFLADRDRACSVPTAAVPSGYRSPGSQPRLLDSDLPVAA